MPKLPRHLIQRFASRLGGAFVVAGPIVLVLNAIQLLTELYGSEPRAQLPETITIVILVALLIPIGLLLLRWSGASLAAQTDVLHGEVLNEDGEVIYNDHARHERESRAILAPNSDVAGARRLVVRFSRREHHLSA